jgi:hypothetical protein
VALRAGIACERTVCPNDCNGRGICYTQEQLADEFNAVYEKPWDAKKELGCLCDLGFRGPDCSLREYTRTHATAPWHDAHPQTRLWIPTPHATFARERWPVCVRLC